MKKEEVQRKQQRKVTGGNGSPGTGGLVQGRQKRTRKLRMEVDWTLLLLPPSPKGGRRRRRKERVVKAKISKKNPKKQEKSKDKQNQD